MNARRTISLAAILLSALLLGGAASGGNEALLDPASLTAKAPESFRVRFETSKGNFVVEIQREWAALGADRFYNLVQAGFYDGVRFFRVLDGFMAQFGLNGDPAVNKVWSDTRFKDDPVFKSNTRGTITFATAGPHSRTTQMFINFKDNANLDGRGFAPIGAVVDGMDVVDSLHSGYGEGAPRGKGPEQKRIVAEGNEYLEKDFSELDFVKQARVIGR